MRGAAESVNTSLYPGCFGVVFYSKATDAEGYEITADSLRALFEHLEQPELVRRVYFVDDSQQEFQTALLQILLSCVAQTCPGADVVQQTDNGSIYNAVNRVWDLVSEEYVVYFLSDFRMIQTLSLRTVVQAFERYPELYLIYLRVRGLFGYNGAVKDQARQTYAWYRDYPDDEKETWYYRDEQNRVYSIPHRLYVKQNAMPKEQRGVQLVPRFIDANNTLWTPKLPSELLPTCPIHESFAGGAVVLRTNVVRQYCPLPKKYRNRPAADCLEAYFLTRDIDSRFYTGYLNLQAFVVPLDPKRPIQRIPREQWEEFRQRNSRPIIESDRNSFLEIELRALRMLHTLMLTRYRRIVARYVMRGFARLRRFT